MWNSGNCRQSPCPGKNLAAVATGQVGHVAPGSFLGATAFSVCTHKHYLRCKSGKIKAHTTQCKTVTTFHWTGSDCIRIDQFYLVSPLEKLHKHRMEIWKFASRHKRNYPTLTFLNWHGRRRLCFLHICWHWWEIVSINTEIKISICELHIILSEMNYIKMTWTYLYFFFKFQSLRNIALHIKRIWKDKFLL